MAVVKIWPIKGRLDHPLNYIKDPEKTRAYSSTGNEKEDKMIREAIQTLEGVVAYAADESKTMGEEFVTGVSCEPNSALEEFMEVKRRFGKEDKILAYHAYQSFKPGEVSPELAHKIGVEFSKRAWGGFQVVVATHLNTSSLHNHFVVNSVSLIDGKKLRAKWWVELRKISDEICREHKLSVVENPKGKSMPYKVAVAERDGRPTRLMIARQIIDEVIEVSPTITEFQTNLRSLGFVVQLDENRKSWTIKQFNWERPIRMHRLGEEYSKERIVERVGENPSSVRMNLQRISKARGYQYNIPTRLEKLKNMSGLKRLYLHYCYLLGYLPKYNQNPMRVSYHLRDELLKMEYIAQETRFLCRENIDTADDLAKVKQKILDQVDTMTNIRGNLNREIRHKGTTEARHEKIKERKKEINEMLRECRRELRMCESIATRSGIIEKNIGLVAEQEQGRNQRSNQRNSWQDYSR